MGCYDKHALAGCVLTILVRCFLLFSVTLLLTCLFNLTSEAECRRSMSSAADRRWHPPTFFAEVWEDSQDVNEVDYAIPREIHGDNFRRRFTRDTKYADPLLRRFQLEAFGEIFQLELKPSQQLLAPNFRVYFRNHPNKTKRSSATLTDHLGGKEYDKECLYSGHLISESKSLAAIDLCDGMKGFIRTELTDYLIEPVGEVQLPKNHSGTVYTPDVHKGHQHQYEPESFNPHIIYKRSLSTGNSDLKRRRRLRRYFRSNAPLLNEHEVHQNYYCGKRKRYMPHKPTHHFWLPGEFPANSSRQKRNSNHQSRDTRRKSVEMLVVVDQEMLKKHGAENVTTYVLTVFNMVSMLYQDETIGNNVSVVLVGLVLLEGPEPGLTLTYNADQSLNSFCQWQSTVQAMNGSHHDHAILLTGLDICSWKDEPCDTLGYAPISGMCSKYRSCTINEDSGLALAFTVAHEVGHKSVRSFCLENEPDATTEFQFPDTLPGELYDADMQCKLQFGSRSRLCKFYGNEHDICRSLWCQRNGRQCETKFLPAAEGTACGHKKWCRRGKCIDQDELIQPIDGGWSNFSKWSYCSRSCGGGIAVSERKCNNPSPLHGGQYCQGEHLTYKICNTQPCSHVDSDTRMEQCQLFNNKTFRGKSYNWVPYSRDLGAMARCRVYCTPEKADFLLVLSMKLPNGFPCHQSTFGVCIDGECRSVGCDDVVESPSLPDLCGVCGGDNTTCQVISGSYTEQHTIPGYYKVVTIPSGARNVVIRELKESSSYLAVRNSSSYYYLTGQWTVDWPGRYKAAGTELLYRRWYGQSETLQAEGPTKEELIIEVLLRGHNPGISYTFTLPMLNKEKNPSTDFGGETKKYLWKTLHSPCSKTCGGGLQSMMAYCFDDQGQRVENHFCPVSLKPQENTTSCNVQDCPARWFAKPWTPCTRSCGGGWQYREVICIQGIDADLFKPVSHFLCSPSQKPIFRRRCNEHQCMSRSYYYKIVSKGKKHPLPKDFRCQDKYCHSLHSGRARSSQVWLTGEWTRCSATCGEGWQWREVWCNTTQGSRKKPRNSASLCKESTKPPSTQSCSMDPCPHITEQRGTSFVDDCKDIPNICLLVEEKNLCVIKTYKKLCCASCKHK